MVDPVRQDALRAHTVVIKIGTNVLADASGRLDRARIQSLADQLHRVHGLGRKVVLVTSGSDRGGCRQARPRQAADRSRRICRPAPRSDRPQLMQLYQESLSPARRARRRRSCSPPATSTAAPATSTSATRSAPCSSTGRLPIINENDTVSVAEIKFGDNDHLAAMVTNLLRAPCSCCSRTWMASIPTIRERIRLRNCWRPCRTSTNPSPTWPRYKSELGTGGMRSKLRGRPAGDGRRVNR